MMNMLKGGGDESDSVHKDAPVAVAQDTHESLLNGFLAAYCATCFGGLTKREIDLLVFQLLIKTEQILLTDGQQNISRTLRIPISKVKSLIYETQLRDDSCNANWFRTETLKTLQTARLWANKTEGHIKLSIDNPMLRKELESKIKQLNGFADYSFNGDILKIDFDIYAELLKILVIDPDDLQQLEKTLRDALKNEKAELPHWKDLVNAMLMGAASKTGEKAVEITIDLSLGFLTGGSTVLLQTLKKLISIKT
jgi:hypothetical protein